VRNLVASGYAAETVRKAFQLAAAVLEDAADSGMIAATPMRGIKLPSVERPEMRFLSVPQVDQLSRAIDPRYRVLVLTAAYSGLRFGELAGLQAQDFDLPRRRLTVRRTLSEIRGAVSFGPPKTAAARRTVTLPEWLNLEVAFQVRRDPEPDQLVFTAPEGGPLRANHFRRRVWRPSVDRSVGRPMRFHDLRHTHAALLIAADVHAKVIQMRLGHASIRTTLDLHGHLMEGLDADAADRLEALSSQALAASPRPGASDVVSPMDSSKRRRA